MIFAEGVTKRFGDRLVLDRVSLSVRSGEIAVIVGPNGAGKSTLLRALGGTLRVDAGQVKLGSIEVAHAAPMDLARVRALLPQRSDVVFEQTAGDIVELGLFATTPTASVARKLTDHGLARVGLSEARDARLSELSGGEQQRVHLARVLAQLGAHEDLPSLRGKALFLDEPLSSQDPRWQLAIVELVRELAGRDLAVVCVVHDLAMAARCGTRVVGLREGLVHFDGAPAEALTPATLRALYDIDFHVDVPGTGAILPRR